VIFAAATGLRPAEWLALEWCDVDLKARVVYVHRSFTKGRLKCPKTDASRRAVPLQRIALDAIERQPSKRQSGRVPRASEPLPAQLPQLRLEAGADRGRDRATAQDLSPTHFRHLRAPCRHIHLRPLPLHGRQPDHDRPRLRPPRPRPTRARDPPPRPAQQNSVHGGRWWTLRGRRPAQLAPAETTALVAKQAKTTSPLTDSNRRPPLYEEGRCVKLVCSCIAQSGRCWWRLWVASGAHLSIASW
jgi:hypothetical protein